MQTIRALPNGMLYMLSHNLWLLNGRGVSFPARSQNPPQKRPCLRPRYCLLPRISTGQVLRIGLRWLWRWSVAGARFGDSLCGSVELNGLPRDKRFGVASNDFIDPAYMLQAGDAGKNVPCFFYAFVELIVCKRDVRLAILAVLLFCFALSDPIVGAYGQGVVKRHAMRFCKVLSFGLDANFDFWREVEIFESIGGVGGPNVVACGQ